MSYVVYDTNIASLAVEGRTPAALAARLAGTVEIVSFVTVGELAKWSEIRSRDNEGLPLVTRNGKDFADFAEHHGLVLISD